MDTFESLSQKWASQDAKLSKTLNLNSRVIKQLVHSQAKQTVQPFIWANAIALMCGIVFTTVMVQFTLEYSQITHLYLSGITVSLWSVFVTITAIMLLGKAVKLDFAKPVEQVQKDLANVRLSALAYFRLSLLIVPFYLAFTLVGFMVFFGVDLWAVASANWLVAQGIFSGLLALLTAVLFRFLTPKNIEHPVVKKLFDGFGNQAAEAAELLSELSDKK